MPSVLFVCTANRFRSPLAAAIFAKALAEEEKARSIPWGIGAAREWRVASAGISAVSQEPVLPAVLEAAQQFGLDLSAHRSQRVDDLRLSDFDLFIVMQENQKLVLKSEYPELEERIYLLSHIAEYETYDIPDLYTSPQGVMGVCVIINELIRRSLTYICVLAIALHNKRALA